MDDFDVQALPDGTTTRSVNPDPFLYSPGEIIADQQASIYSAFGHAGERVASRSFASLAEPTRLPAYYSVPFGQARRK
jgi:hypothetical protein